MVSSASYSRSEAFTLTELMVVVAIVSILVVAAGVLIPHYVAKAKTAEAEIALAEVRRLETEFFARTGSYSSDLNQIGFHPVPSLKYHTVFVQVEKGPGGWRYMVLLMPNGDNNTSGGKYVSQGPDGTFASSMPSQAGAGGGSGSGCAVWNGWGTMEGGRIEGEEGLSSSRNGTPACGGRRVVQHGNGSGPTVSGK
jgi:prepilin-type N-terminal cleavage/methylation domain-containing protein